MASLNIKKLSVSSFIADLPNAFNNNFKVIVDFIDSIYNSMTSTLTVKNIECEGKISSNSVHSKNIICEDGTKNISMKSLIDKMNELEKTLKTMEERIKKLENNA